jgi:hypothetical protein
MLGCPPQKMYPTCAGRGVPAPAGASAPAAAPAQTPAAAPAPLAAGRNRELIWSLGAVGGVLLLVRMISGDARRGR